MIETILLTATVDPGNVQAAVKDPIQRLTQYATSLLCWVRTGPFDRIVVCENSGYENLEPLHKIAASTSKKVEILSFRGNVEAQTRGKGYGEAEIMEHAFRNSKLIRESWTVWKVTGRLYVLNAEKIRKVHLGDRHVMTSDTRFYKISQNFYWCHLHHLKDGLDDSRSEGFIESVYGHQLMAMNEGYVKVFREQIILAGQGGGSGSWYGDYPEWAVTEATGLTAASRAAGSKGAQPPGPR